jgi:hypothetical protein
VETVWKDLLREIRSRAPAHAGDPDRRIALYGRPDPALAAVPTEELIESLRAAQRASYSADERRDIFEVQTTAVREAAAATVVLVKAKQLTPTGTDQYEMSGKPFGKQYALCSGEQFFDQPCVGFCSGVLVASDLVATAAHCVPGIQPDQRRTALAEIRFVFGFYMQDAATPVLRVPAEYVFRGVELVGFAQDDATGADWALVRLDRAVSHASPARLRRRGRVADQARLAIIGYPCGLPVKYAPGASVRRNDQVSCFRADLDAFGGNSGSPVFGADWTVEGLLVRGATDFVWDGTCRKSLVIPVRDEVDDPPGEDCVRVAEFQSHVPQ